MCKMLYIGASDPLPIIDWDENTPSFHVIELNRVLDKKVRTQFSLPHVFYAGSYERCGCGFTEGHNQEDDNPSLEARKSLADLARYLEEALLNGISVQLFYCWDGDQGDLAENIGQVKLSEISGGRFDFKEKQLLEIV